MLQLMGGRERSRQPANHGGTVGQGLGTLQADRLKFLLQAQQQGECSERLVRSNGAERGGHNQEKGHGHHDQRADGEELQQQQQKQGGSPAIARQRYLRRCLLLHALQPARTALLLHGHPAARSSKIPSWVPSEERSNLCGHAASDHALASNGPAAASQLAVRLAGAGSLEAAFNAASACVGSLSVADLADLNAGGERSGSSTPRYLPGWNEGIATASESGSSAFSTASDAEPAAGDSTAALRETQVCTAKPCGEGRLMPYVGPEHAVHLMLYSPPSGCWLTEVWDVANQVYPRALTHPPLRECAARLLCHRMSRPLSTLYHPSRLAGMHMQPYAAVMASKLSQCIPFPRSDAVCLD